MALYAGLKGSRGPPNRGGGGPGFGDRGGRGFGGRGGGRGGGGGRGRGAPFTKARPEDPRVNSEVQIFVENLPLDVKMQEIKSYFSSVGEIKVDRLTKKPRIWLYHDKDTGQPTGECTITYNSAQVQTMALQTYDGAGFRGGASVLRVTPSIVKSHMARPPPPPARGRGGRGGRGGPPRGGGRGGPPRGRGGSPGRGGGPMRGRGGFGGGGRGRGGGGGYGGGGYGGEGYGGRDRGGYGGGDRGGFGGGGRYNPY